MLKTGLVIDLPALFCFLHLQPFNPSHQGFLASGRAGRHLKPARVPAFDFPAEWVIVSPFLCRRTLTLQMQPFFVLLKK